MISRSICQTILKLKKEKRWELKDEFYEKRRELDGLKEDRNLQMAKEKNYRDKITLKFLEIVEKHGSESALYFIDQYKKIKQRKAEEAQPNVEIGRLSAILTLKNF